MMNYSYSHPLQCLAANIMLSTPEVGFISTDTASSGEETADERSSGRLEVIHEKILISGSNQRKYNRPFLILQ